MPPKKDQGKDHKTGEIPDDAHRYQANDTTHKEEDQWKFREPYRIHEDNEKFPVEWTGQCHCGKVKYQLSRDKPLACKYCHCKTCQRLHAAPFQWAAIFHKKDINFTHGHHDLGWYDPTAKDISHHLPCKVSCAFCRTPIMDEGRNMILLYPGLIDKVEEERGRKAFRATCHMFYPNRVMDFPDDGLVKWEGLDNQSNILNDKGEILVKYEKGMSTEEMDEKKRKAIELAGEHDEVKRVKERKL